MFVSMRLIYGCFLLILTIGYGIFSIFLFFFFITFFISKSDCSFYMQEVRYQIRFLQM